MRAPVSRSRPLFLRCAGLLVGDHPLVGDLGLLGELALGVAHRAVGGPDPGGAVRVLRGAGGDLELGGVSSWSATGVGGRSPLSGVSMHQNRIASLRAVATIALPCPRRALVRS